MNILITGAAGFIGSNLAEFYLNQGHTVYGLDDLSTGSLDNIAAFLSHPQFHFIKSNLLTFDEYAQLADVELVYHLAAEVGPFEVIQHPEKVLTVNIETTKRLLQACITFKKKPRFIFASTSEVYGPKHQSPLTEDSDLIISDTTSCRATYSLSKVAGESYVNTFIHQHQLPATILRPFNTIGPRQTGRYGMVVPRFVKSAVSNQPITVFSDGQQTRSFIDIRDSVMLLSQIAQCQQLIGETVNIGHEEEISIINLALLVKKLAHSQSEIQFLTFKEAYDEEFLDFTVRVPDLTKLRKHIDMRFAWDLNKTLLDLIKTAKM